jgi:site-specific recombinase XerC
MQYDLIETWLNNVATSHSDSYRTRVAYKSNLELILNFIGKTPEQIMAGYNDSKDRRFKRQYAQHIKAFASAEFKRGMARSTINTRLAPIKSFFKYNDLPLGYVPMPKMRITYHNRDITHEEVKLILDASRPRERAFYAILAQSGLRPFTICNLRFKHIKEDLISNRIPCKIDVPIEIAKGQYRGYFTFISHEAAQYSKAYLHTRGKIEDNDFLFAKQGTKQQANPKSFSSLFSRTVQKLQEKGLIEVEQKERDKPRDVRLYSLRKFFRKHANQAGFELVQFWMGHIVNAGQEEHYRPTDVEFHRKLYAEKAMPFLRLETVTPTETEKTIDELKKQLAERNQEVKAMKETIAKIQPVIEFVNTFTHPREVKEMLDFVRADYEFARSSFDPNIWFDKHIADKLDEIVRKEGVTQAEALKRLIKEDWELTLEGHEKMKRRAKARGVPMTREEYEEKKKKLLRKHLKKDSKTD